MQNILDGVCDLIEADFQNWLDEMEEKLKQEYNKKTKLKGDNIEHCRQRLY